MYPLNDKDLDRLSREAAEHLDVEAGASGWEQLEQKLDRAMPVEEEKRRRRFFWIFLLAALLCGSGLTWILRSATQTRTSPLSASQAAPENRDSVNTTAIGPSVSGQKPLETPEPQQKTAAGKHLQGEPVTPGSNHTAPGNAITLRSSGQGLPNAIRQNKPSRTNALPGQEFSNYDPEARLDPVARQQEMPSWSTSGISESALRASMPRRLATDRNTVSVAPLSAPSLAIARQPSAKDKEKNRQPSRISLGLLTGTDISSIHGSAMRDPGFDIGLTAAYRFSKRWYVSSGFIVTVKNYQAAGKDYHPPKQYWTNYIDLQKLEGDCFMWEIPLNLRYDIRSTPKLTWFASAGLTSYIMRRQNYTYYYTYKNTPTVRDWSYHSQSNYWLGVLNLSGGFEKKLSPAWSIQAEPFVKLPLRGVGFGRMDISSYGLYLTLKFTPLKNSPAPVPKSP